MLRNCIRGRVDIVYESCRLASWWLSLVPNGLAIIVKLRPLKEGASLFLRDVARVAHPEVSAPVFLLLLNDTKHRRDTALAFWGEVRVEIRLVVPVGNVDASVSGDRVRVDGLRGGNTVLPLLLHLRMHHQQ